MECQQLDILIKLHGTVLELYLLMIKLSEKYQTEREDICNKLINILNL